MHTSGSNHTLDCIAAKRDGFPLTGDQIARLIADYVAGEVPDYQMSAFLMAVYLQGMDDEETVALTGSMIASGEVLDLTSVPGLKVDKHSTGGVGDKVSLVLAPLVAELGVHVPMISGRSLGHSGGTLDKLESIPGFRADLTAAEMKRELDEVGLFITGQTGEIAPADRKLYALRDVTGTVACVPLITASILSKKIAAGIDGLVLDVKFGSGAFMTTRSSAMELAESLVSVGGRFGKEIVALLTDMNRPLGYGVGNWPEIVDVVRMLRGETIPELTELVTILTGEMLALAGVAGNADEGREQAAESLQSGKPFERFCRMVSAQGGDTRILDNPLDRDGFVPVQTVCAPPKMKGTVVHLDARLIGEIAMRLGAGRTRKTDRVDPLAGLILNKKPGDRVEPGEELARLFTGSKEFPSKLAQEVTDAYHVSSVPYIEPPVVAGRFASGTWDFSV